MSTELDLIELESLIDEKQLELATIRESNKVENVEQLEREIDALQTRYIRMKEGFKPGEERPSGEAGLLLPDLDEQIDFMKQAQDPSCCNPASAEMVAAIYQSLLGAKKFLQAKEMGPVKERDERAIEVIARPFNLNNQIRFIQQMIGMIGLEPGSKVRVDVLKMYEGILDNLSMCVWVADITAERLLELPSNQPIPSKKETDSVNSVMSTHIGSLGVFVQQDIDKSWLAYFEDWCGQPEISGTGMSPEEAVANLFKAREQKRQAELFPDGKEAANV